MHAATGASLLVLFAASAVVPHARAESPWDSAMNIMSIMCRKANVSHDEQLLSTTRDTMISCVSGQLRLDRLAVDVMNYSRHGALDELFSDRCKSADSVMSKCVGPALDALRPCLSQPRTNAANVNVSSMVYDMLEAGVQFVCGRSGERIALLLAVRDNCTVTNSTRQTVLECLKRRGESETLSDDQYDLDEVLAQTLDVMVGDADACKRMTSMHVCTVEGMATCKDPTMSNLLDSMLRALERTLPCPSVPQTGGAGIAGLASWTVLLALAWWSLLL